MSEQLLLQILEELKEVKREQQEFKNEMKHEFEQVKDHLRIIIDQTAKNSELESPITEIQDVVKNHDADIKLIKRLLTN